MSEIFLRTKLENAGPRCSTLKFYRILPKIFEYTNLNIPNIVLSHVKYLTNLGINFFQVCNFWEGAEIVRNFFKDPIGKRRADRAAAR